MFRVRYMTAPGLNVVFCRIDVADKEGFKAVGTLNLKRAEFKSLRERFDAEFIEETPEFA